MPEVEQARPEVRRASGELRILHVISSIDARTGGPAVAVVGLASAQRRAGLNVRVVAMQWAGDNRSAVDVLREQGIQVNLIVPTGGPFKRRAAIASAVTHATADVNLVHIHALWEEIQHQASVAARRAGVPYLFRPCGMLDPWSLRQSRWKKELYLRWRLRRDLNGAAAIHYTADLERDLASPLRLAPPSIVEPNGVDLSEFRTLPPAGTFRSRYSQIGDRPLVLFLSRLHPKKGLDLLLPAFAKGAPAQAVLVIAGPGEDTYRRQLKDMARALRVDDRVLFTGMLRGTDRVAALTDADLFVLPSYQENFGIAIVEALAAGTPAIISDQVNIHRELSAAGVAGVVSLAVDVLARELDRWLDDAALRDGAAARCRAFVWAHYDWSIIAQRWAEHYRRLTGR